ncbi:hypothetical protein C8J57DRAFT_1580549 [Mycena rebaudengoi]|nr:hypothetical protein C8J57DRAFT_1580549 [Mycena rebaudengoi]
MPSNFPPQQSLRPLNLISSSDEAMLHPRRTKSGYARLPAELDLDNYEPKGISGQNFLIRGAHPSNRQTRFAFLGWPAVVILAQTVLLLAGWIFFVTVTPTPLTTLVAGVALSRRSIVFDRNNWKWTTLLTPTTIIISTPLVGSELDLASSAFSMERMEQMPAFNTCFWKTNLNGKFHLRESSSGYAAANAYFGIPSSVTLFERSFNVSTGGILPTSLDNKTARTWTSNGTQIPTMMKSTSPIPAGGLSQNFSMTQQGSTADVSCSFTKNLPADSIPSSTFKNDTVQKWRSGFTDDQIVYVRSTTKCPSRYNCRVVVFTGHVIHYATVNSTRGYVTSEWNILTGMICDPSSEDLNSYILTAMVWYGKGVYKTLNGIMCKASTKITSVQVDYSSSINTTVRSVTARVPNGPADLFGRYTLYNLVQAQTMVGNTVGENMIQLGGSAEKQDGEDTLRAMEEYMRGVVEHSGTLLRACVAGSVFKDGIPPELLTAANGTFCTEALGWAYKSPTTRWILVPSTLVALSTIIIIVMAVYQHGGRIPTGETFDATNPMHLIAVAASGGLDHTFKGISDEEIEKAAQLEVVLGSVEAGPPALVRADSARLKEGL